MSLRIRRGVDADRQTKTFDLAEPVYITDTGKLIIGDGVTVGGKTLTLGLVDETTPELGGNLDLNGNNIVGTGNINIDGTITATGNITLGDGAEDNVIVGGQISSSLIPETDNTYDLGNSLSTWRNGYFSTINTQTIDADVALLTTIFSSDSSSLNIEANTNIIGDLSINGLITANSIEADVQGSVFSEDSSIIIDANSNSINLGTMQLTDSTISLNESSFEINFDQTKITSVDWGEIDSDLLNAPRLQTRASRTSNNENAVIQTGDITSVFLGTMFDGNDFILSSGMVTTVQPSEGTTSFPTKLDFLIAGTNDDQITALSLNPNGVASANIFQTGTYANEAERDAAIPQPAAGMIILLSGHDDSTGVAKFQGYNGNDWVDFT
jgi:hypothetical protein